MALEPRVYTRTTKETVEGILLTEESMVEVAGTLALSGKVRSVEMFRDGRLVVLVVSTKECRSEKFRVGDFIEFLEAGGIKRVYPSSSTSTWAEA